MRHLLLLALSFCPLTSLLLAQDTPATPKSAIKLRVLAEVVPEALGPVYLLAGEARTAEFELPANNVSDPIAVAGRSLILKTSAANLSLCTFTLPAEGKSFVVIFSPAKPAGYKAEMVRTDDPSFKRGDVFFLNRTDQTILGKLGTKELVLASGKTAISRPEGATEGVYYDVAFAARSEAGNKLLSTVRWPVDDQIRSYVFFVQDPTGRISYRAVDEFMPKDK
jgi:hypothetical protein